MRAALLLFAVGLVAVACRPGPTEADGGTEPPDAGPTDAGPGEDDGGWPVPISPISIAPHESWKSELKLFNDPFIVGAGDGMRWVKFTVLMRDPSKVYFQNSNTYPFHGPFAIERLDPFKGLTLEQFEAVSLHQQGQEAITGAVLLPPYGRANEAGVQLVRQEPYSKQMVKRVFDLVVSALDMPSGTAVFYLPTFEQAAAAEAERAWFLANQVNLASADRWSDGSVCYSGGWALGRLVEVAPAELEAAYADGRLTANDILLIDGVPAEVPPVAGIITRRPSSPNSHVAILAGTLGAPFVYTPHEADAQGLKSLEGKQVVMRTGPAEQGGRCEFDFFAANPSMSPTVRDQLLGLKAPSPINFLPKQHRGAFSAAVDALQPADVAYFGGKTTNFGVLRRTVPNNSYAAVGLSFDLWDDVMAQSLPAGNSLRDEIAARLAPHHNWPPSLPALKATLAGIRTLIRGQATFSTQAQAGVRAALASFDPVRRIRFRSSTNVEDDADFTGAGLYDSYSGCLADDDDIDVVGPSHCEADEEDERGVFRAIRQVYASFYNDNAYLERLRHGVDETKVGMAMLVHYSVPDEIEQANGVVTAVVTEHSTRLLIVTQLGADSVTNPTGESTPEEMSGYRSSAIGLSFELMRSSSRVPLGAWVMGQADYAKLDELMTRVEGEFRQRVAVPFALDFEFKKIAPGTMYLKQVRQMPLPDSTPSVVPFMLQRQARLCVAQGEFGDVFANHRAKLTFEPQVLEQRLTAQARGQSLFGSASLTMFAGGSQTTLTGAPATWPGAAHQSTGELISDTFSFGSGANGRVVELTMTLPLLLTQGQSPIITVPDVMATLSSTWAQPQPTINYLGVVTTTTQETVRLGECPADTVITPEHTKQSRTFVGANGLVVKTSYWWPPAPTGVQAGYTAPLVKWERSELSGLTSEPIVFSSDDAQTYRPGHHNFSEDFIFDPSREPSVTQAQRDELTARNVHWLLVSGSPLQPTFHALGFDGQLRELPVQ